MRSRLATGMSVVALDTDKSSCPAASDADNAGSRSSTMARKGDHDRARVTASAIAGSDKGTNAEGGDIVADINRHYRIVRSCHDKATNGAMVRYMAMSNNLHAKRRQQDGQHVVARPRVTDALGQALRCAFDEPPGTPGDMIDMLRKLDASLYRVN